MDPKELRAAGNQNVYPVVRSGEGSEVQEWGLTKREHFAAMAMQGLCANPGGPIQANGMSGWGLCNCTMDQIGELAASLADSTLRALAAGGEG